MLLMNIGFRALACVVAASLLVACGGGGTDERVADDADITRGREADGSGTPPVIRILAGQMGGAGNQDAQGAAARFNVPSALARDAAGNVYVADTSSCLVRRISQTGAVSTFAGTPGRCGHRDGAAAQSLFRAPQGVAVDSAGTVYVSDTGNAVIRRIRGGVVETVAGVVDRIGAIDGGSGVGRLYSPQGLTMYRDGRRLLVADSGNHAIRLIDPDTRVIATAYGTLGVPGEPPASGGSVLSLRLNRPNDVRDDPVTGVVISSSANGYVLMIPPGTSSVYRLSAAGILGVGYKPVGVATNASGSFVHMWSNGTSTYLMRTMLSPSGGYDTSYLAGNATGYADGAGSNAMFGMAVHGLLGMVSGGNGRIFVADAGNNVIRQVEMNGATVTTVAGTVVSPGSVDGTGEQARFASPLGIAVDRQGDLLITDASPAMNSQLFGGAFTQNNDIRRIALPTGKVSRLVGFAGPDGGPNDGPIPTGTFQHPSTLAASPDGKIFVLDGRDYGEASKIRFITDGFVGFFQTYTNLVHGTSQMVQDSQGRLLVAQSNGLDRHITRFAPSGGGSIVAGAPGRIGGENGDGTSQASFGSPLGMVMAPNGDVFVVDKGNRSVRKLKHRADDAFDVETVASFLPESIQSIALAQDGSLNVSAPEDHTILRIAPGSDVATIFAGTKGVQGYLPGSLPGLLSEPRSLAVANGKLYVTMDRGVVEIGPLP
jgi:sugar lactone lactonase YvrE